jgi:hypothetical protein
MLLGHEADHSPPANAEVKKMWIYTSTSPSAFMVYCLISLAQGQLYLTLLINHCHKLGDHACILYLSRTTNGSTVYSVKKCMDFILSAPITEMHGGSSS